MTTIPYRLGVASRVLAAIGGGYAVAALAAMCIALLLPTRSDEAVLTGMLSSFTIYVGAVIWVFAARSASRAWAGIALTCVVLGGVWALGRI